MQLGAVEINKSSIICAIGNDSGEIISKTSFNYTNAEDAIAEIIQYYKTKRIKGLGIALSKHSQAFSDYNLLDEIKKYFRIPVGLYSLADAAIIAEASLGSCKGIKNCIYITNEPIAEWSAISDGKLLDNQPLLDCNNDAVQSLIASYSPEKIVTNNPNICYSNVIAPKLNDTIGLIGALMHIRKMA